jgi:Tol biopolymer transport system component
MGRASQERRKRPASAKAPAGKRDVPTGPGMWRYVGAGLAVVAVAVFAARLLTRTQTDWKDGSPAWSPDGKRIAFYSERDGNSEIYVMNADGSAVTRLTNSKADEGYPAWSADGRTISFDSDRDGNFEIFAMNAADGSNARALTKHPARDVSATWSPDGKTIVFMSDRDGGFDAYEAAPETGAPATRVTQTGTTWFPVYSPDGTTLAFHIGRDVHTLPAPSRVEGAAGGDPKRLTVDPANGMYPSWSPDGKRLAFMSWRNGRTELFTMNADGSDQKRLVSMDRGDAVDPRWSPDGSRIAFVHLPDGMNGSGAIICTVNADGTGLRHLR